MNWRLQRIKGPNKQEMSYKEDIYYCDKVQACNGWGNTVVLVCCGRVLNFSGLISHLLGLFTSDNSPCSWKNYIFHTKRLFTKTLNPKQLWDSAIINNFYTSVFLTVTCQKHGQYVVARSAFEMLMEEKKICREAHVIYQESGQGPTSRIVHLLQKSCDLLLI